MLQRLDRKMLAITTAGDLAGVPDALTAFNVELISPRRLEFRYRPSQTRIRDILSAVRGAGISIADLTTHEARLEDIFLELTRDEPAKRRA